MNNPKTEEIVEALMCRVHCDDCTEECVCYSNKDFDCASNFTVLTAAANRLESQQQELNETSKKPSAKAEFFGRLRVDSPDLKLMLPRGALKAAGIGFGDCVGVIVAKGCISLLKYAHDPYKTAKHCDFSKHIRQEDTHESNPD